MSFKLATGKAVEQAPKAKERVPEYKDVQDAINGMKTGSQGSIDLKAIPLGHARVLIQRAQKAAGDAGKYVTRHDKEGDALKVWRV